MYGPPPSPRQVEIAASVGDLPEAWLASLLVGVVLVAVGLWLQRRNEMGAAALVILGHVLALTARQTGARQLGAAYSVTPFPTARWTASEMGSLYKRPLRGPRQLRRLLWMMERTNATHLVISDPFLADTDGDGVTDPLDPYPRDPWPEYMVVRNELGTIDLMLSNRDGTFGASVEVGEAYGGGGQHRLPVQCLCGLGLQF